MSRIYFVLACCLLVAVPALANTPPEVTNVSAAQRPHTALIDVTYDVTDLDGDAVYVSFWYSLDDGVSWDQECVAVSGDVGFGVLPAVGLSCTWDVGVDIPDFINTQFSIRVYADDGSGVPACFVYIESGTFVMGSPEDELGRQSDETQHQVTLTHPFYIQNTEVTNQQYIVLAQWAVDNGYATATSSSLSDALDGSTVALLDLDVGNC